MAARYVRFPISSLQDATTGTLGNFTRFTFDGVPDLPIHVAGSTFDHHEIHVTGNSALTLQSITFRGQTLTPTIKATYSNPAVSTWSASFAGNNADLGQVRCTGSYVWSAPTTNRYAPVIHKYYSATDSDESVYYLDQDTSGSKVAYVVKMDPISGRVLAQSPNFRTDYLLSPQFNIYFGTIAADRIYIPSAFGSAQSDAVVMQWMTIGADLVGPWTKVIVPGPPPLSGRNPQGGVPFGNYFYIFDAYYDSAANRTFVQAYRGLLDGSAPYEKVGSPYSLNYGDRVADAESPPEACVAIGDGIFFTLEGSKSIRFDPVTYVYSVGVSGPNDLVNFLTEADLSSVAGFGGGGFIGAGYDEYANFFVPGYTFDADTGGDISITTNSEKIFYWPGLGTPYQLLAAISANATANFRSVVYVDDDRGIAYAAHKFTANTKEWQIVRIDMATKIPEWVGTYTGTMSDAYFLTRCVEASLLAASLVDRRVRFS